MTVALPFREPRLGQDYWIEDNILPNALEVAQRCIANSTWTLGSPWRPEPWPGMRAPMPFCPRNCVTSRSASHDDSASRLCNRKPIRTWEFPAIIIYNFVAGPKAWHVLTSIPQLFAIMRRSCTSTLIPRPLMRGRRFTGSACREKNPGATSAHGNMKVCGTFPGCLKKWILRSLRKFWRCLTCSIDSWPTNPT